MLNAHRIGLKGRVGGALYKISIRRFAENPNDIAKRIASTKSIQKITKSMKMVSAAKLRGDTNRLMDGRGFGKGLSQIIAPTEWEEGEVKPTYKKPLYLMINSDKGLCGGVNGYVAKKVKSQLEIDVAAGLEPKVMVIGDKGAPLMQRTHGEYVLGSFTEPWKTPVNFVKCLALCERIVKLAEAEGSDVIRITYNKFVNSIRYDTEFKDVPVFQTLMTEEGETAQLPVPLNRYEVEYESTDEAVKNIMEYTLCVNLYGCALESATSEQSSRMTAMDNASKNASEMVESLTVKFNRARQAKITTELTEIISGAESLKG